MNLRNIKTPGKGNFITYSSPTKVDKGISAGSKIRYDPNNDKLSSGEFRPAAVGLSHELLGHAYDADTGKTKKGKDGEINRNEINAVNIENHVRHDLGVDKRTSYDGKEIPSNLLEDTHSNHKEK